MKRKSYEFLPPHSGGEPLSDWGVLRTMTEDGELLAHLHGYLLDLNARLTKIEKLMLPLTPAEAEKELEEASDAPPLSEEVVEEVVSRVAGQKYAYSLDGEKFVGDYDSREEALDVCIRYHGDGAVWTGKRVWPRASFYLGLVLEGLQEDASDHLRELSDDVIDDVTDDWLDDVSPEQERELLQALEVVLDAWADKYGFHPLFWFITDVQKSRV